MDLVVFTDKELIRALSGKVAERNKAIEQLVNDRAIKNRIVSFVLARGGTKHEAREIFHDALLNLVKSVVKGNYDPTHSLENYLFGIARHLWLKKYAANIKEATLEFHENRHTTKAIPPDILLIEQDRKDAVNELMQKLGEPCRTVLTLWATGYSSQEISEEMEHTEKYTRVQIHRCKRKLEKLLEKNRRLLNRIRK